MRWVYDGPAAADEVQVILGDAGCAEPRREYGSTWSIHEKGHHAADGQSAWGWWGVIVQLVEVSWGSAARTRASAARITSCSSSVS